MSSVKITIEVPANESLLEDLFELLGKYQITAGNSSSGQNYQSKADGESVVAKQIAYIERLLGKSARRPIANGQKGLINALIDVPWEVGISRDELLKEIGRSNRELSGLLGAFGKRARGTAGFEDVRDGTTPINTIIYTKKDGQWRYRLKPWVREALDILYERGDVKWLRDGKRY